MSDLRTSIVIDLVGNLVSRAKQYGTAMDQFSRNAQRSMMPLSRVTAAAGRGLDRLGNRYTALIAGGSAAAAGRMLVGLELRFERLGIQANRSADEMEALKTQIFDTAQAADIRVSPDEITGAIEAIVEKTGDLKFAEENIRNIGLAIQATGAQGGAIGELMAEFQKMGVKDPKSVLNAIDTLNVQGKEGAFTLQNLAALGPRVITAYTSAVKGARDGATVLKEMGAALQVIRMGTGSSEQAATAFERLLSELQSVEKLKLLKKAGIQVFDPKQPGAEVVRPINELLLEIMAKTNGRRTILGKIFGDESIRAFNAITPERIEQFMKAQGNGETTMKDSARAADTAAAALTNLATAWKQFADGNLTQPIQDLADTLNSLEDGTVQRWMEIGKWVAIIGGGAVLGRKAWKGVGGKVGATAIASTGAALGLTSLAVAPAAAAGYGAGRMIDKHLLSDETRQTIGGTIATILAGFGNRDAQRALDADFASRASMNNVGGKISIEVDDKRARVSSMKSDNPNVDFEASAGLTMGAP